MRGDFLFACSFPIVVFFLCVEIRNVQIGVYIVRVFVVCGRSWRRWRRRVGSGVGGGGARGAGRRPPEGASAAAAAGDLALPALPKELWLMILS